MKGTQAESVCAHLDVQAKSDPRSASVAILELLQD